MRFCSAGLLVVLLLHTLTFPACGVRQYFVHLWQTEDGLPQNAITAIVQTRDGYIWLGTYAGLVRFDGVRFVLFDSSTTAAMKSSRVTSLYEDSSGALWIGHETGEVTQYREGRFQTMPPMGAGKARKVFAIGEDEEGDVWQMDDEGVMTRRRDELLTWRPEAADRSRAAFFHP